MLDGARKSIRPLELLRAGVSCLFEPESYFIGHDSYEGHPVAKLLLHTEKTNFLNPWWRSALALEC